MWTARRTTKWGLEQIKPERSLQAKILKLRLSYIGHTIRQDPLEKTIILGKVESSKKRGRSNIDELTPQRKPFLELTRTEQGS